MRKNPRCLFDCDISTFVHKDKETIFGLLCEEYHGDALTTTRDAWLKEIEIMQTVLLPYEVTDGHVIFEYDIPSANSASSVH